jgi:hypothetical protein
MIMIHRQHFHAVTAVAIALLILSGVAPSGAQAAPSKSSFHVSRFSDLPLTPVSQQNAVRAAKGYLDVMAFSREGLIRQLVQFDGYSTADATFAVDSIPVDWQEQAARAAQGYLDVMPFSGDGLLDQLTSFDGYTYAQAAYGLASVGL